jgi:hypothetical protein
MHEGAEATDATGAGREEFEQMVDGLHATIRSIATGLPAVYGLAAFPTPGRAVGGWASAGGRAERIALVYGEFAGSGPLAVVHTTQGSAEFLAAGLHYGEGTLDPADALSPEDELPVLRRFEHFAAVADLRLWCAGKEIVLHRRESRTAWYAWTDHNATGPSIVIEAAEVAPAVLQLAHIDALTPYLDGHRMLLRNASGVTS